MGHQDQRSERKRAAYGAAAALIEREGLAAIAGLGADYRVELPRLFELTARLLPSLCRDPDAAGARVRYSGEEYAGQGFRETTWCRRATFCDDGEVEVCCPRPCPESHAAALLPEQAVLDAVASQLDAAVRVRAAHAALEANRRVLERRLAMDELAADIAGSFVEATAADVDTLIGDALAAMGRFTGAGRCYLFRIADDGAHMDNTHEWCTPGTEPARERLQGVPTASFPWWMGRLQEDAVIELHGLDDLPEEATVEREILQAQSITALLVVPVWERSRLAGFIGFDWVDGPGGAEPGDARILRLFAQLVGDVVARIEGEEAYERRLRFHRQHDDLTALPNRYLLQDRLERALAQARRRGGQVAVIYADLDRFQRVNEGLGHAAGDRLLVDIAARLREELREEDTVARYTGDEFVVVLAQVEREEAVGLSARRILEAIAAPLDLAGRALCLSASAGIALYPRDGGDSATLLRNAATAMHEAKRAGRNRVQYFRSALNERLLERVTLEEELRSAIGEGQLRVHYQPQYRLADGRMIGLEALVRWQHPRLGLLAPGRFIELAEDSGLIVPLGDAVLLSACAQIGRWRGTPLGELPVAVNVSVRQLESGDLPERVERVLGETGTSPKLLELEVTESALTDDAALAGRQLERIATLGCRLSLDDFGTGYSNLGYLKRFPFQRLKIDQSFVAELTESPQDAAIVRTIVAMGRALDLEVLAEGVEREAQLNYLRRLGCDCVQGFLLARPQPPEALDGAGPAPSLAARLDAAEAERPVLLVVDDEANVGTAIQRALRREPYRVITTTEAHEALDLLAMNEVHVVVADQRMPGMNGTELLSKVKELYPAVIRILLSGYTDIASVTEAVNRGWVYKYLTKPWDDGELRQAIAQAFALYRRELGSCRHRAVCGFAGPEFAPPSEV